MPYQANKPLANDLLSQSQQDIQGNFVVLGSIGGNANNNSAGINTIPGAGFNYLFLTAGPAGGVVPLGTVFGTSNAMYSSLFNYAGGVAQNEIFINKQNQVTQVQIPSTASSLSTVSAPAVNSTGWTMLPSGILIKWGYKTNAGPLWVLGNNTVTFPTGGGIPPFVVTPMSLQVTLAKNGGAALNATIAANLNNNVTDFTLNIIQTVPNPPFPTAINLGALAIYWMAIGRGV